MEAYKVLKVSVFGGVLAMGMVRAQDSLPEKLKKRCDGIQSLSSASDIEMAKSYYFYGDRCATSNKDKKDWHGKGRNAAQRALSGASTPEQVALSHYYAAINLSRWGLANGLLSSLGQWSEVKGHLDKVVEHGVTTADYGAYRTFGRAYYKLPFFKGGSVDKSEKYLEMAYSNTMHPTLKTSTSVLTTLYYLHTLRKQDKDDVFCKVYDGLNGLIPFNEGKATQLNPNLVMENLLDMDNFVKPPKSSDKGEFIREVRDYADINC